MKVSVTEEARASLSSLQLAKALKENAAMAVSASD